MDLTKSSINNQVLSDRHKIRRLAKHPPRLQANMMLSALCVLCALVAHTVFAYDANQQQAQTAPSQMFVSTDASTIARARAGESVDDENAGVNGFIMRAATEERPADMCTNATEPATTDATTLAVTARTDEDDAQTTTEAPVTTTQPAPGDRIAIDANRAQYETHDQLQSASTKDEPIQISPSMQDAQQQQQKPAAGQSRVGFSRMHSILSGKLQWSFCR